MSLKETLLAKMNRQYTSEEIGGVVYWFQSMTPAESMNCSLEATDIKTGKYIPSKFTSMQAKQLAYSLVDGDGGQRLFGDDEWQKLQNLDNKTFHALYKASEKVNGKGADVEEAVGESDSPTS